MIMKESYIFLIVTWIVLSSCKSAQDKNAESKPPVTVVFENQSQFVVEALYIHDAVDNYLQQTNSLENQLQSGDSYQFTLSSGSYYATVYRKPNQDSEVLAYTTALAWDINSFPKLIYYDEQFRTAKE